MKTITECQPLIYGLLMEQAKRRKVRQRKNVRMLRAAMPIGYIMLGLAIVFDAGIMPWDISFWLIFAPFFVFGESVLSAIAQSSSRPEATQETRSANIPVTRETTEAIPARKVREVQKRRNPVRNTQSAAGNAALVLSAFRLRGNDLLHGGKPTPEVAMRSLRVRSAASTARRAVAAV